MSPRVTTARTIWAALLISTFLYLFVATRVPRPAQPAQPILLPVLALVALIDGLLSVVFPAMQLGRALRALNLRVDELQDANAERMFRDLPPTTRAMAEPDDALRRAWPVYQTWFIIAMAQAEAVAVFGLVLMILGFPWFPTILFFVLSWGLMIYQLPSETRLRKAIDRAYGLAAR